ncbi:MAG: hypothetical protein ACXVSE_16240 [Solirubrobacteraceae bacterium]
MPTRGYVVHRIVLVAVLGTLAALAGSHMLATARHSIAAAHTAARLLRCEAVGPDRYDAANPTDPAARCAGVAERLQAETGAGEAAVAPAPPGQ